MRHDFIDHHRSGNSLVHKADPRLKLLMMIIYVLVIVLIPDEFLLLYLIFSLIPISLALISQVSLFHYFQKLGKLYPMIFFITIILPFVPDPNSPSYQVGWFKIYVSGIKNFLIINIKSVFSIFISIILTTTTDFNMLLRGLEKLKVPSVMIAILAFMYRYIFLMIDEVERSLMAYQSRYIRLPLFTKLKTFAKQIAVIFVRTFERGERIYLAMEARGFVGRVYTMNPLHWKNSDTLFLLCFLIVLFLPLIFFLVFMI